MFRGGSSSVKRGRREDRIVEGYKLLAHRTLVFYYLPPFCEKLHNALSAISVPFFSVLSSRSHVPTLPLVMSTYACLVLQPGTVVGFDTEWRPTMCRAGTDERFVMTKGAVKSPVPLTAPFDNMWTLS